MKTILAVAVLLLSSQAAFADTLITFKDGSATVWGDEVYKKGSQYCYQKAYGFEDCAEKSWVVSMRKVDPGTSAMEYGGAASGLPEMSDNMWAAQYDENAEKNRKLRNDADDRARERQHASNVRKYGADKADQMKVSGNSIAVSKESSSSKSSASDPVNIKTYRLR